MPSRSLKWLAPLVALLAAAGCGQSHPPAPAPVPLALAPTGLLGNSLHLYQNTARDTLAAFRQDPKDALISDGKLWEIRRADRLIGTLEIATVKPDVNLSKNDVREQFTAPILVGARSDIRVLGQEVNQVQNEGGLSTFVWFGKGLFLVLQAKDQVVTGPQVAQAIIEYQQSRTEWQPLPQLYSPA